MNEWNEVETGHWRQDRDDGCVIDAFATPAGGLFVFTGPNGENGPMGRCQTVENAKASADGIRWEP